jgi:hypothetical protein
MVEKFGVFDWQAYPLFALSHDIVTAPQHLRERLEEYLLFLRGTESCPI